MSATQIASQPHLKYTEHMFRYLVAHAPTFRLDRCGWSPHQPAILVAEEKNALRVQAATPAAARAGIRPGMSVAGARARLPQIETELLDPEAEAADLEALTAQLLRVSPSIAALPPDAVVAEISRVPGGLAGSERALVERVRIRMAQLGHTVNVVVADDPTTAHCVAQWQQGCAIIPTGGSASALAPLPLRAIGLPAREHTLLEGLGIHTIGDLARLPAAAITGRFGAVVLAAHALACGRTPGPALSPWTEDAPPSLSQDLPAPVAELEALFFVLGALVRDLSARLTARAEATAQLNLSFRLDGGRHQSISLRLGSPTRHPTTILSKIRHRLERFKLGGPVVALTLSASQTAPFDGRQVDLRDPHRRDEAIEDVSASLQDTLGSRSVLGVRSTPRHRPEGAWRPVPFGIPVPRHTAAAATALAQAHGPDPVVAWTGHPETPAPDRPPILLNPPTMVEVDAQTGSSLRAIHVDGRWHGITQLLGPEQIAGEWWQRPFQRTYWRATLDDGRIAWLYREHGRWALHGWWDR
jgi:protein ImuB